MTVTITPSCFFKSSKIKIPTEIKLNITIQKLIFRFFIHFIIDNSFLYLLLTHFFILIYYPNNSFTNNIFNYYTKTGVQAGLSTIIPLFPP